MTAMTSLYDARKAAANGALAKYDFEPAMVSGTSSWNAEDDRYNEWTCVLSMDGELGPYTCGFIVRFVPGTATVREAYPGDPH